VSIFIPRIPIKIDLHVHAKERSVCSKVSEEEMIQTAIDAGLDAIVFTDHNKLTPKRTLNKLNRQFAPFRIFGGIEVSIKNEHIIVLGIYDKLHRKILQRAR
jgi:predicted metal-dependent phosphoesterase TrpH